MKYLLVAPLGGRLRGDVLAVKEMDSMDVKGSGTACAHRILRDTRQRHPKLVTEKEGHVWRRERCKFGFRKNDEGLTPLIPACTLAW